MDDEAAAAAKTDAIAATALEQLVDLPPSDAMAVTYANLALVAETRSLRLAGTGDSTDESDEEATEFETRALDQIARPPSQSAGKAVALSVLAVASETKALRHSIG